ncbi:hypothetical protein PQG02_13835 [Nostoc sp. UHCC 0926]|nr:hypothetical protein [Nostoc sp. UHCC 0926]WDD35325.1 hypothetical protein PQG02_13835 [Nostoc sp. UHCC 0926]
MRGHFQVATAQFDDFPFVPEAARAEVIRSTRWQLGIYAGA